MIKKESYLSKAYLDFAQVRNNFTISFLTTELHGVSTEEHCQTSN